MQTKDLEQIFLQCHPLIISTGKFLLKELGKVKGTDIEVKSLNSLVSYVDKTAEEKLVEGLQKILPEATFMTEEETIINQEGELQWIIDPLDGTTNFLHGLPLFSISVALRYKEEIVLGIIHEPSHNECFYAWKGGGAFLNEHSIKVSEASSLADSLIATGFPYYDYASISPYFEALEYFMRHSRGLRRLGSAALDLAYVACGRFDAFFEYSLNAWDVAGGAIIVKEAGGEVVDFSGKGNYLFGKELIATNQGISDAMLKVIFKAFQKAV